MPPTTSEMAAIAPHAIDRLCLIAPAGLWLDEHPIPDLFALLPFELPALLFHDPAKGAALRPAGADFSDPVWLQEFLIGNSRRLGTAVTGLDEPTARGVTQHPYSGHQTLEVPRLVRGSVIDDDDLVRGAPGAFENGREACVSAGDLVEHRNHD